MCGIIGIIGNDNVTDRLIESLKKLEYRGYDSAGISVNIGNDIDRRRAKGKIVELEKVLESNPISGNLGVGHTRWATHGAPAISNAHPHATEKVSLVHNGIIENFQSLRSELIEKGYKFHTDTDTEVIPNLIQYNLDNGKSPEEAVKDAVSKLQGAFAIGVIFKDYDDLIIAARKGSPLAIGYGDGEMYLGSDALTLAPLTKQISYLEDGDIAILRRSSCKIYDGSSNEVNREIISISSIDNAASKGNYKHYMLKEIYEQPTVIGTTLKSFYHPITGEITLPEMDFDLKDISRVTIVACGTSFYAGLVCKYWLEGIAKISVDIDVASEFRYREPILEEGGLVIVISQSGETADTLAALKYANEKQQHTLAIVNVDESTMAREADCVLKTHAGPEIGVASTKAFTTQLIALACLTLELADSRNAITSTEKKNYADSLSEIPSRSLEVLHHEEVIKNIAKELVNANDIIYIGRGSSYPIALEGALKLKEISYIHAEANAAGELKHGSIALIDDNVPIIAIAPSDHLFDKTAANIQEVVAREGKVILLSDKKGIDALKDIVFDTIELPDAQPFASPLLYAIPIQLIAYHVAVLKGTDIDQPRNLAKSVTVE